MNKVDEASLFPATLEDPFNEENKQNENIVSSSWRSTSQTTSNMAPRWQILTNEEKLEQDKIIQKLESKLKKLDKKKEKPVPNYNSEIIPDVSHQFFSSDSEGEEEEESRHIEEEVEEGLPLLWKSKSIDPSDAPRKTEGQYNKKPWWLSCCFCF